jgi:mannose-6-phosphate isomerase
MKPLMQERIWGGRNLEKLGRALPEGKKIGESWELVDRPEAQSVVVETGETLGSLWSGSQQEKIFGRRAPEEKHFPILIKLLDAEEKLSLQVHPPAKKAKQMGGEPKTEMWFFLETKAGAEIYVGFKKGVGRGEF